MDVVVVVPVVEILAVMGVIVNRVSAVKLKTSINFIMLKNYRYINDFKNHL